MNNWIIHEDGFDSEKAAALGNRFLIGNGLIGIRGTLPEYKKDKLPAINLAGIYDRVSDWREPVNLPNGCYSYLRVDGNYYEIGKTDPVSHEMALDYRHGIFSGKTVFRTPGGSVTLEYERFCSMDEKRLYCMRWRISADFHADIELAAGFDWDVWDLNGPHLTNVRAEVCSLQAADSKPEGNSIYVSARTHEAGIALGEADGILAGFRHENQVEAGEKTMMHRIFFVTMPGEVYTIDKLNVVGVENYPDPSASGRVENASHQVREDCLARLKDCMQKGYDELYRAHIEKWEELWKHAEVTIEGDDEAMEALNYSLYHLNSIAPRHSGSLSIPARGLSGQTYRGAVFWDTEMFMLDFFLMTDPQVARALIRYRVDTLPGALAKAKEYGWDGAFYAWESQEGGYDACSDYNVTDVFTGRPMRTYFRDKQVHISSAIVYGMVQYINWTGDRTILDEAGVSTIVECAKFYYSLLSKRVNRDTYDINDVIGPDEYHERINNNYYTNRMARFVFETACELIPAAAKEGTLSAAYDGQKLMDEFTDALQHLYLPSPGKNYNHPKVIEQFDGYFDLEDCSLNAVRSRLLHEKEYWGGAYGVASQTQIIKQADVVTALNLFPGDYPDADVLKANFDYYEPRTEHGSSLSAGMYSMLACKIGSPDAAYPFFMKSAKADLTDGGKEWAGLLYIGGTHPAAAGAAYMTAVLGFAGVTIENGRLSARPCLPSSITSMSFYLMYQGNVYHICVDHEKAEVHLVEK